MPQRGNAGSPPAIEPQEGMQSTGQAVVHGTLVEDEELDDYDPMDVRGLLMPPNSQSSSAVSEEDTNMEPEEDRKRCQVCLDGTTQARLVCGRENCGAVICLKGGPEGAEYGCIDFHEIDMERTFLCLRCCLETKVPFMVNVSTFLAWVSPVVVVNVPLVVTGLKYQDRFTPGVFDAILMALRAAYAANDAHNIRFTKQLVMGQVRANTSALRKEANFDDALSYLQAQPVSGWLAIVDSHSIIGAGGILTHERSSRNGRVTTNVGQRVSKVMNRWFGDDMMGLIRRPPGARHLRILVLCVCGPIFTVNQSLADLKSIVEGDYLDAIVGFSREVLTPQLVYQALSSFCIAAYTMCHFADTEPWMRVKRAVETGFAGQRTLFEHTPVIVISKGPDGVECTGFGYGSPNRMPWGIEPPACGHCGKHANIKANSKMGELVYEDSEKRSITLYMTKKAKYRCRNCNYRTPYLAMPSGIKLWRNPAVKNHFSYPYPTVFPDIKWTLPETKSASTPATPATSAAPLAHTGRRGQARTKHFKRKRSDEPITTMYDVGSDFDGDSDEDD